MIRSVRPGRPVCPRWSKSAVVCPGCCTRYCTGMAPHSCNSIFLLLAVSYVPKYEINRYDWRITNMPSRSLGIARRRLHSAKISRIFYLQDKCRNSAAAPGVPASSPKPSALCRSAKPEPEGKGSVVWPRLDGKGHLPEAEAVQVPLAGYRCDNVAVMERCVQERTLSPALTGPCRECREGSIRLHRGAPEPRNRARIRRNPGICHQQVHEAGFDKGNANGVIAVPAESAGLQLHLGAVMLMPY